MGRALACIRRTRVSILSIPCDPQQSQEQLLSMVVWAPETNKVCLSVAGSVVGHLSAWGVAMTANGLECISV